jgi:hypothetical protein
MNQQLVTLHTVVKLARYTVLATWFQGVYPGLGVVDFCKSYTAFYFP